MKQKDEQGTERCKQGSVHSFKKRFWNTYTAHALGAGRCGTDQVQGPSSSDHMTWGREQ